MRAPCVPRATQGLRARSGSEPLHGSAWFGSVWGGFVGGILGGIARAGFSHRRVLSRTPLIIRTVDQKRRKRKETLREKLFAIYGGRKSDGRVPCRRWRMEIESGGRLTLGSSQFVG